MSEPQSDPYARRYRDHTDPGDIAAYGASRNKVRNSDSVEPKFNIPGRPSKLDFTPTSCRRRCGRKRGSRASRSAQSKNCTGLAALGYDGSYNRVVAFRSADGRLLGKQEQKTCGCWRVRAAGVFGGEAFQFDWSEDWAVIGGERTKLQVALVLSSSPTAAPSFSGPIRSRESTRCCSDAHNHAFRVLGGCAAGWGIYDNMRTAVDADRPRQGAPGQRSLRGDGQPFPIRRRVLHPASGWEKGQIEKNVQDARHRLWQPIPDFLASGANDCCCCCARAETRCRELWAPARCTAPTRRDRRRMGRRSRAPDAFAPVRRFRRTRQARVPDVPGPSGPQSLLRAGVVRQSSGQPAGVSRAHRRRRRGAGRVRASPRFCPLPRTGRATTTAGDWRDHSAVVHRKPGALRNGAPFAELPPAFRTLQQRMLKTPGGDREMVEILALVLQHDEQAVLAAVELALEAGAPTKTPYSECCTGWSTAKPIDPPAEAAQPPGRSPQSRKPTSSATTLLRKAPRGAPGQRDPAAGGDHHHAAQSQNARHGLYGRRADRTRLPAFEVAVPILAVALKARGRPTERSDRRPISSRPPASRTIAISPVSTSPAARSTRRSHVNSIAASLEDAHNVVLVGGPGDRQDAVSPRRSVSRRSSITASAFGSSPPSNSSTLLNKRSFRANRARSRPRSSTRSRHPRRAQLPARARDG